MLSSLRVLAWRVLEQGRRVLLQRSVALSRPAFALPQPPPLGSTSRAPQPNQSFLQRYLLVQQQALKQSIPVGSRPRGRGGGGGPNSPDGAASRGAVVPHAPPLAGLLGRLGPLVSGAVRRLASVRRPSSSGGRRLLYRDTAPLFALVGVTLAGVGDDGEDDGGETVLKRRGFVTRQEELEAICCTIRDAVSRSGWLFDPESWVPYPHTRYSSKLPNTDNDEDAANHNEPSDVAAHGDEINSNVHQETNSKKTGNVREEAVVSDAEHVYSLQDLELDGVIDKGCNAVVYAARWKRDESPAVKANTTADVTHHTDADRDLRAASPSSASASAFHRSTSPHTIDHAKPAPSNANCAAAAAATGATPSSSEHVLNHNTLVNSLSPQHMQSALGDDNDNEYTYNINDRLNLNDTFNESITSLCNRSNNNNNIGQHDGGRLSNVLDSNFLTQLNSSVHSFEQLSCSSSSAFGGNPGRQGLLTVLPLHGSTVSLSMPPVSVGDAVGFERELGEVPSELLSATTGYSNDLRCRMLRSRQLSGSVAENLLLSSGGFGLSPPRPQRTNKRVRFQAPPLSDDRQRGNASHAINEVSLGQDNPTSNNNTAAPAGEGPSSPATGEIGQFPLAVKLVFNYEAASNAPAILSALYRELLPARTLQLDATYDHWRRERARGAEGEVVTGAARETPTPTHLGAAATAASFRQARNL